jgi:hypothetical protein
MPLLSNSEILFLQGQKQVSKSYEYKLKSIIKKKLANLLDNEIPLLAKSFPDLTEFGKNCSQDKGKIHLTEFGMAGVNKIITNNVDNVDENYNNPVKIPNKITKRHSSPAQIRTGVKGSKGLYAWPLHSAFNNKYYRASRALYIKFTYIIIFTNWNAHMKQVFQWDPPFHSVSYWLLI